MSRHGKRKMYDIVHDKAKIINTVAICVLSTLSAYFFTYGPFVAGLVCLNSTVVLFQHGNNAIGWLLEEIKGLRHRHKRW